MMYIIMHSFGGNIPPFFDEVQIPFPIGNVSITEPLVSYLGNKYKDMPNEGMGSKMREWAQGIRKRRERQVRAIQQGQPPLPFRSSRPWADRRDRWREESAPWNRPGWWAEEPKKNNNGRLLYQTFAAFLLLSFTYLVFQSDSTMSRRTQEWISEALHRDFNFAGVAEWYRTYAGNAEDFLPAFSGVMDNQSVKPTPSWYTPVKGKVAQPFAKDGRGVVIRSTNSAPVVAASDGWVVFVGSKPGLGKTVVIRHADGRETWYGWLETVRVRSKDWVAGKQLLGEIGQSGGRPLLYFALRRNGTFVNPAEVIPFE
jgi:stage IV sporulation protein FA